MTTDPIKQTASVNKIQTLADGGLRWTFDVPETAVLASAHLMEIKRNGVAVEMTLVPVVVEKSKESDVQVNY